MVKSWELVARHVNDTAPFTPWDAENRQFRSPDRKDSQWIHKEFGDAFKHGTKGNFSYIELRSRQLHHARLPTPRTSKPSLSKYLPVGTKKATVPSACISQTKSMTWCYGIGRRGVRRSGHLEEQPLSRIAKNAHTLISLSLIYSLGQPQSRLYLDHQISHGRRSVPYHPRGIIFNEFTLTM